MRFVEGKESSGVSYDEIVDNLKSRDRKKINSDPDELQIGNDGKNIFLQVYNGGVKEYPIRKSFAYKLLKWHFFPVNKLYILNIDTVTSLLNDFLLAIRSNTVDVTIENGEALTITSENYNELSDIYILEELKKSGVKSVDRNDFFMRLFTEEKAKIEPFVGDTFGVGINIINSETGFRALTVSNYLLRLICSNGMLVHVNNTENKLFHYGHKSGTLQNFLKESIGKAANNKEELLRRIAGTNKLLDEEELKKLKYRIQKLIGANDAKFIFANLNKSNLKYDYINALTSYAKNLKIGKRLMVEEFAGQLIMN